MCQQVFPKTLVFFFQVSQLYTRHGNLRVTCNQWLLIFEVLKWSYRVKWLGNYAKHQLNRHRVVQDRRGWGVSVGMLILKRWIFGFLTYKFSMEIWDCNYLGLTNMYLYLYLHIYIYSFSFTCCFSSFQIDMLAAIEGCTDAWLKSFIDVRD